MERRERRERSGSEAWCGLPCRWWGGSGVIRWGFAGTERFCHCFLANHGFPMWPTLNELSAHAGLIFINKRDVQLSAVSSTVSVSKDSNSRDVIS